ncbi:MAG: hypothetical protein F4X91_02960 [Nitrospinae bacterium]|nr:hypothetical protein [Nitrospinota bacterium]
MGKSLKDKNRYRLALVVLANIAAYMAMLNNKGFGIEPWIETLTNIQKLVPGLLVSVLTSVINAQIDHVNKARLVFWKWRHPLPGSRAFTECASMDLRIDMDALLNYQDPLPTDPEKQNALWFKWYRGLQNEPGIEQAHREYLFTRDYTSISFLLIVGLGSLGLWEIEDIQIASIYLFSLVAQYFLARRAARNHGVRFVGSVLAYKASSE